MRANRISIPKNHSPNWNWMKKKQMQDTTPEEEIKSIEDRQQFLTSQLDILEYKKEQLELEISKVRKERDANLISISVLKALDKAMKHKGL
jgi:hypothetical protein